MAAAPDGSVWFTLSGSSDGKEFGRIEPDGTVTEYDTPNGNPVTAVDVRALQDCADNNGDNGNGVWFTQAGSLLRWDAATASGVVEPAPNLADPADISVSGCGQFWIADRTNGLLGGFQDGYAYPWFQDRVTHADSIAAGADGGNVQWSDPETTTINRARVYDDGEDYSWEFSEVALDGAGIELSKGQNRALDLIDELGQVAFTNAGGSNGNAGTIDDYYFADLEPIDTPGIDPLGIAAGLNGNYWIANRGSDDLSQITPTGIYRAGVDLPDGSEPTYLVSGTTGDLWVGLAGTKAIARISDIDPAPARPVVSDIQAQSDAEGTTVQFDLSQAGKVRIAIRLKGKGRVIRKVKLDAVAGHNEFDLGPGLDGGDYRATATAFAWVPDWQTRVESWSKTKNFQVQEWLAPPKARVEVRGHRAFLFYSFRKKTAVRVVVHRRVRKRLKVESVSATYLPAGKRRYAIGKFPRGRYVVRFTRSIRVNQDEVVVSNPTIIRFRIRR